MSSRRPRPAGAPSADPHADTSSDRDFGGSLSASPLADRRVGAARRGDPDPQPNRTGFFAATSADFDGAGTDELVRTVGLLVGACSSELQLARLARELAAHVDRRDARIVLDQLAWRLGIVRSFHERADAFPDCDPFTAPQ